ncbi:MAG TPA: LON peptidase substrate-binding domain-containing protein [Oceanipulchritudo sp.]|nr:LON peptidase substrate-binding domain-containing protein [Oceanipulchritudo sp.]
MDELSEISIPEIIPVMTLHGTVLFPHAVMPLFIFEQRYRQMLTDVLNSNRLFAIFNEREHDNEEGHEEPPEIMGTIGVVRAAHQNPDGTSNLALQGIRRVRLVEIVQESPYRLIRIAPCTDALDSEEVLPDCRKRILDLLDKQPQLTSGIPEEYVKFIQSLDNPGPFIDVAVHSLCHNPRIKQQLLETLSLSKRFDLFFNFLSCECQRHDLFRLLQGQTREEEIDLNCL